MMANLTGNFFKYKLLTKVISFSADVFKARLMTTGFVFNRSTMRKWADTGVSTSELAGINGYTTGGVSLAGVAVTEDDVNNDVTVTWTNPSWTASGGSIGPTAGLMVVDYTDTDVCIVLYIPFSPEQTQVSGGTFAVANVEYELVDTNVQI
jgi:hypothetical protein